VFLFSLQKQCDGNSFPLLNSLNIMRCGLKTCLSCQFWYFYPFKGPSDVFLFLGWSCEIPTYQNKSVDTHRGFIITSLNLGAL
jgi:hypothetical protein